MKSKTFAGLLIPAFAALVMMGCEKSDPLSAPEDEMNATEDAAESIASAIGSDNGGVADQLSDVIELASVGGIQKQSSDLLGKYSDVTEVAEIDTSYDPTTGTWTLKLSRERGNPNGVPYAQISRTYTYQFLNENGQPQKYYIVGMDTANTIKFNIIEGTGIHRTRRLSQQLTGLSGSFIATGVNTRLITINGNYERSAVDTITTRNSVRTLDHTLKLTLTDVQVPAGRRFEHRRKITGTISGTYTAFVTFQRGASYSEKNINREFTIELGDGECNINIRGLKFVGDLFLGELKRLAR
jgi:hypothetical protein